MKVCPVCKKDTNQEHRKCVLELFKQDKIQSVKEWEAMCVDPVKRVVIRVKASQL